MAKVLKLKISLVDSSPLIWRELVIRDDIPFEELHKYIQIAFNWTNTHLHSFQIGKMSIAPAEASEGSKEELTTKNSIKEFLFEKGQRIRYTYDFGDDWEHDIRIVDTMEAEGHIQYPVCTKGKMNCPPEDAGGIHRFQEMRDGIKAKKRGAQFKEYKEWLGGEYDSEYFDIDDINEALKNPDDFLIENIFEEGAF